MTTFYIVPFFNFVIFSVFLCQPIGFVMHSLAFTDAGMTRIDGLHIYNLKVFEFNLNFGDACTRLRRQHSFVVCVKQTRNGIIVNWNRIHGIWDLAEVGCVCIESPRKNTKNTLIKRNNHHHQSYFFQQTTQNSSISTEQVPF